MRRFAVLTHLRAIDEQPELKENCKTRLLFHTASQLEQSLHFLNPDEGKDWSNERSAIWNARANCRSRYKQKSPRNYVSRNFSNNGYESLTDE